MENIKNELVQNYSDYLKVDLQDEISNLEETIEDMLTRLEEFESLMDGLHSGGTNSLLQVVPEIQISCQALEGLFSRVDHIEGLVARVRKDLNCLEERLDAADDAPADLSLRSLLKPLFSKKTEAPPGSSAKSPTYEPPDIFNTEEFFPQTQEK